VSSKYKFLNPEGTYFITLTVRDWVAVFTRNEYKDLLLENLKYCQQNKGLEIFAWCIMSNHLHLIVRAGNLFPLQDIFRDFKKHTSKLMQQAITNNLKESRKKCLLQQFNTSKGFRLWQEGNHPIELWSNKVIFQKLNYIHQNPVEAGFVFRAEDYSYSSAIDYSDGKGFLEVILIG